MVVRDEFRVSGRILLILLFKLDLLDITETKRAADRNVLDSAIIRMDDSNVQLRIIKYYKISKKGRNGGRRFGGLILNDSSAAMRY